MVSIVRAGRARGATHFGAVAAVAAKSADENLLATLVGANFNITTDQSIALPGGVYRLTKITTTNTSTSMTTAAGGFYTAASKAGAPLVAAAQVYSGMVTAPNVVTCTLANVLSVLTPIYFALTSGQGTAATADIRVYGVKVRA